MKKEFSRPDEIWLNFLASDLLKVISNYLRTEKGFSRPDEVLLNFLASDLLKVISNFLRTETFYVMKGLASDQSPSKL